MQWSTVPCAEIQLRMHSRQMHFVISDPGRRLRRLLRPELYLLGFKLGPTPVASNSLRRLADLEVDL